MNARARRWWRTTADSLTRGDLMCLGAALAFTTDIVLPYVPAAVRFVVLVAWIVVCWRYAHRPPPPDPLQRLKAEHRSMEYALGKAMLPVLEDLAKALENLELPTSDEESQ